jgi:hypothetical protein
VRVRTFVASALLAAAAVSAPAVADEIVRFARNAGRVDNLSAVPAHGKHRAGKLVATNDEGRFPTAVLGTAPNARRLGRHLPADYAQTCLEGVIVGSALVPGDLGPTDTRIAAWQYVKSIGSGHVGCTLQDFLEARRVETGVYRVSFVTGTTCDGGQPPQTYRTLVTVKSPEPLMSSSQTVCDDDEFPVEEVRIFDPAGAPTDATFTIALLSHTAPLP